MLPNFDSYYLVTEFDHESPVIVIQSIAQLMDEFVSVLSERDRLILQHVMYNTGAWGLRVIDRKGRTIEATLEDIAEDSPPGCTLVHLDEKVSDAEVGEAMQLVNNWHAQRKPCPLLFRPNELIEGFKPLPEKIEFKDLLAVNDNFNLFNTKGR